MKFLLGLCLFYFLSILMLYVMQRNMIYFPARYVPELIDGVEVVKITTDDGQKIQGWYIDGGDHDKPAILLFHGNAGNHGHRIHKVQFYVQAGYRVLIAGYRGYGGNGGTPSEAGFYKDGNHYIEWLKVNKRISVQDLVLYGESIGSGTATHLARQYDIKALILETPFDSLLNVAATKYFFVPVRLLLKDRFLNSDKIHQINAPLLILHGKNDRVIPFSSAEALFDKALEPKEFISFPQANHNNLYTFDAHQHILNFLAGIDSKN